MRSQEAEPVELQMSSEKLFFIIVKAREFDAKVAPAEPHSGSNPGDDAESKILEDYPDDPTGEELKTAIDQLTDEDLFYIRSSSKDVTTWGLSLTENEVHRRLEITPRRVSGKK